MRLYRVLYSLPLASAVQAAALSSLYERLFGLGTQDGTQHVLGNPISELRVETECHNPFRHSARPRKPTGFVAFGDSYSAGIGTHIDGKENDCRQGTGAYPFLINKDLLASDGKPNGSSSFQWLSCTGSTTTEVLMGGATSQIDTFNVSFGSPNEHPDFATLSIGGNDLGFFDVMNACVFRFYSFSSGSCDAALEAAEKMIAGTEFNFRLELILTEILDKVRWETKPWFVITVTGYTKFFNAETTACDDASLGIWWDGPKLKQSVRQRMNELVRAVNGKLRQTIDDFNRHYYTPKVFFVDYDNEFDGHRFCEPNVIEPDYNRTETWFFLPGGADNAPGDVPHGPGTPPPPPNNTNILSRFGMETLSPSSPLVDPDSCLPAAQKSGDWGELALCYMAIAKQKDPSLRLARDEFTAENSMWYVPTYYGKTFHPRTLGYRVVRDKVYEVWEQHGYI